MSAFYIILLLIGSVTLSKKIAELRKSIKTGNKEKMKAAIFFLLLTIVIIAALIAIKKIYLSTAS